jgi:hypothetical protein
VPGVREQDHDPQGWLRFLHDVRTYGRVRLTIDRANGLPVSGTLRSVCLRDQRQAGVDPKRKWRSAECSRPLSVTADVLTEVNVAVQWRRVEAGVA